LIFQKIISDGRKNPYSFSRLFEELTGRPFKNRPIFQPPMLTPLREAIAESTVGDIYKLRRATTADFPKAFQTRG